MHQTHVSIAYRWFFPLLLSTVLSFSCATKNKHPQTVTIDGSSTVYPITIATDNEFEKTGKNIRITVGVSGTTAGLRRFAAGEIDIADASRPIRKVESDGVQLGVSIEDILK